MASQTYTSSNNIASSTTSVVTTYPVEQGGGCLTWGSMEGLNTSGVQSTNFISGIGTNELNYKNRITTSGTVTADGADLYSEVQNLVALFTRVQPTGLSSVALPATTGSINYVMTPRAVIFRIQQICTAMLSQPNV